MTRAEMYRQKEKREALWINRYSRGTYVIWHMVKSFVFCTLGTLCVVAIWAMYRSEWLLSIYDMDIFVILGKRILMGYVAALAVVEGISWLTYRRRHRRARASVKDYYVMLRKLDSYYEKSRQRLTETLPLRKEGGQI